MKTVEELRSMTHEGLVEYAEGLQKELKEAREGSTYIYNEKVRLEEKFNNFKNMVKSLVVLVD